MSEARRTAAQSAALGGGLVLLGEAMRVRHRAQVELIDARIAELEVALAEQPGSTVIEQRIAQLRRRRDTLQGLVDGP